MAIEFLHEKKHYVIYAESYNELSCKQLMAISKLFCLQLDKELAELKALRILLGMSRYSFFRLANDAKLRMLEEIQWVFDGRSSLTKVLIPYYRNIIGPWYYGPASEFDNLTMAEWNACEIFYEQIVSADDEEALNNLFAVLYRPAKKGYDKKKDPEGDIREPFNPNTLDARAKKIASFPFHVRYAILQWYDGCRQYLIGLYDVFDGEEDSSPKQPGMFELMSGLSGGKYGIYKDVELLNVHMAMREMVLLKQQAEELKKLYPTT